MVNAKVKSQFEYAMASFDAQKTTKGEIAHKRPALIVLCHNHAILILFAEMADG